MKINKTTINSNFKFQTSIVDPTILKRNSQKPSYSQAYEKILYPQGLEYWIELHKPAPDDFKDIETLTLKNNVLSNIDKNSPENKIALKMYFIPTQQQNVNPAVKFLHRKMLDNIGHYENDSDNFVTFYSANAKAMEICANWDKKDFLVMLKKFLQDFHTLKFSEKELELEKEFILDDFNYQQNNEAFNRLYGAKKFTKEDIKAITSDDIKKFHNDLLLNSAILCTISIPKGANETTVEQIKGIIESQIPNKKPFNDDVLSKTPLPIEKDEVFYLEPSSEFGELVSKTFNFQNSLTLKDQVISDLIGAALEEIMYKNYLQDTKSLKCFHNADFLNKHFKAYIMADKNAQINENMINSTIKSITESPIDDKFFEKIKQRVLKSRKEDLKTSISRAELLSYKPAQTSSANEDYSSVLNSISPKELQQKAQIILCSPSITEIRR